MQNVKVRPTPRRTCRGELHWFCSFYWRVITKGHPGSDIPTLSSFHSYSSTRTSNIATITDLPRILIFLSILPSHDSRPNNLSLTTAAAGEIVFHFQAKSNEVLLIVSNHHHFTIIKYYYPLSSWPTNNTHLVLVATVGAAVGGGGGGLAQEFTFSQTWLFSTQWSPLRLHCWPTLGNLQPSATSSLVGVWKSFGFILILAFVTHWSTLDPKVKSFREKLFPSKPK